MHIDRHPELLDRLASAYALGTLRGGARRRFEALARERAPVRAAALLWQSRLAGLTELAPAVEPADAVWTRIDNLVQADRDAAAMAARATAGPAPAPAAPGGWWRNLPLWRGAAAAGVAAAVVALVGGASERERLGQEVAGLQARLSAQPELRYVAVLNDERAAAAMLVTFDPKNGRLTLQRVGGYQEASDKSLQLWALPPQGGPRSLGVLTPERLLTLTAGEADVRAVPALAISLEPKGGVPSERGPTGPVLFKGALIQRDS